MPGITYLFSLLLLFDFKMSSTNEKTDDAKKQSGASEDKLVGAFVSLITNA